MLVLSRREDDRVLFPGLGISVHILKVSGNKIRLGIDAPADVRVLRHELPDHRDEAPRLGARGRPGDRIEGRVRAAGRSLGELHKLCDRDLGPESKRLVMDIFRQLRSIDEQAATRERRKPVISPGAARRALLVEDNANESKLLAGYLRLKRFEVDIAHNGHDAISYLESHNEPDLVLLDMKMPRMDGPTAIRRIRADGRRRGLKVFAVSGSDPADYGVEVGPAGVDAWFPKPLDPEALVFRLAFDESRPSGESPADRPPAATRAPATPNADHAEKRETRRQALHKEASGHRGPPPQRATSS